MSDESVGYNRRISRFYGIVELNQKCSRRAHNKACPCSCPRNVIIFLCARIRTPCRMRPCSASIDFVFDLLLCCHLHHLHLSHAGRFSHASLLVFPPLPARQSKSEAATEIVTFSFARIFGVMPRNQRCFISEDF